MYLQGPARHLGVSRQKLSPHCLETVFDSQLPSPKLSHKMPPKLSLAHKRGHSFLFPKLPPRFVPQHQDVSSGPLGIFLVHNGKQELPRYPYGTEKPAATEVQQKFLSGPVLRDTARLSQRYPHIARYGVFGVSAWPLGCDTPSPFSEHFPLGEHAKWRCDTPPLKRGISAILARYPMKTRQMGAIPPSAILSRKGIARYGGVSRTGPLREVL